MLREIRSTVYSPRSTVKDLLLCLLSAILLILSYPVFNIEILAWFAFVPFFFAVQNQSLKKVFLLSYLTGLIFWLGTIYWIIHVTPIGLILLVLYLALYFGAFGVLFRLLTIDHRLSAITVPGAWIFLEFIRSKLFTGFPWALLGYSQYLNLPVIQIADITGVWGVSFLVMMVNITVYLVASPLRRGFASLRSRRSPVVGRGGSRTAPTIAVLFVFLSLIYGFYKLHKLPITNYRLPITVSIIQGNIPQYQKWDENFREEIISRYEALTKEAAKDKPDLIIWPETSVPGVIGEEPELLGRVLRLAREIEKPILVGAVTSHQSPVTSHQSQTTSYYNSALLISPEGKILEQYDKLHLVPFGEFVPLEKHFPRLRDLIGVPIGDFTAGEEYTILRSPLTGHRSPVRFAVLICFEDTFPGISRKLVKNGAEFLVNMTNDAWFMESSAPYQHAQASVFRAVENRVPVVRAANTGLSCFIDETGRIYDKVSVGKKDIFVVGYGTAEILVKNEK